MYIYSTGMQSHTHALWMCHSLLVLLVDFAYDFVDHELLLEELLVGLLLLLLLLLQLPFQLLLVAHHLLVPLQLTLTLRIRSTVILLLHLAGDLRVSFLEEKLQHFTGV